VQKTGCKRPLSLKKQRFLEKNDLFHSTRHLERGRGVRQLCVSGCRCVRGAVACVVGVCSGGVSVGMSVGWWVSGVMVVGSCVGECLGACVGACVGECMQSWV
jgi:hypothetical protein